MSDLPETIWAVHGNTEGAVVNGAWADTIRHFCGGIEYRRADLVAPATPPMPLTPAQIMSDPRVKALVEAGEVMARALHGDYIVPGSAKVWDAAIAQLKGPKP